MPPGIDQARYVRFLRNFSNLAGGSGYYRRLAQLARLDGSVAVIMTQPYLYRPAMSGDEPSVLYIDKLNGGGSSSSWSVKMALSGMDHMSDPPKRSLSTRESP